MSISTPGIHHVTAIASDPARNLGFYTDVLGLRLVKKTVNFDDPRTYHLYYGDEVGTPGTSLTFFPFGNTRAGRQGAGQVRTTAFQVPPGSLDYWRDRLADRGVDAETGERFDERALAFEDPDGLPLELVAHPDAGTADVEPWDGGDVPAEHAVRGFRGVTLALGDPGPTADLLEFMGLEREARASGDSRQRADGDDGRLRFRGSAARGTVVDLVAADGRGVQGSGTVHHVAFRAPDRETQEAWREELLERGLRVTDVKDRRYFESIYFREPGGVLFEIATDGPGFTRDEDVESLGTGLRLPPWLEDDRADIESRLPDLDRTPAEAER